jgi:antitoxin HicB
MKKAKKRNPHWGSTLNEFLQEEGIKAEVKAETVTRVVAWQLKAHLKRLAQRRQSWRRK